MKALISIILKGISDEFKEKDKLKVKGYLQLHGFVLFLIACAFISSAFSTPKTPKGKLRGFPILGYSTETHLQMGGMLIYFLPTSNPDFRPPTIRTAGIATLKGQYKADVFPKISFDKGQWIGESRLVARHWPANYYPPGNHSPDSAMSYVAKNSEFFISLERKVGSSFFIGPRYRFKKEAIRSHIKKALLTHGESGGNGFQSSGIALLLKYDNRDNTNAPLKGLLVQSEVEALPRFLGTDQYYSLFSISGAYYLPLKRKSVLATHLLLKLGFGEIPFREKQTPDGTNLLRGIEKGRYRDKHLLGAQVEYRFPLFWRLGMVVFVDIAQVNHDIKFSINDFKTSMGLGGRFALSRPHRLNARGDLAYVDGNPRISIYIKEAF